MPENDSISHPRQRLNNLLQSMGMVNDLRWDVSSEGPPHGRIWHAICLVKGRELGNGRAYKKGKAMDEAARMALKALSSNPPPSITMLTLRRRNSFP